MASSDSVQQYNITKKAEMDLTVIANAINREYGMEYTVSDLMEEAIVYFVDAIMTNGIRKRF